MTGQAVTGRSGVVHVCTGAQGPGQGCQVYEAAALRYRTTYDAARQAHAAIAAATEAADVAEASWRAASEELASLERLAGIPACRPPLADVSQQLREEVDGPGPEWRREADKEAQL